jgi:hypothetical protein
MRYYNILQEMALDRVFYHGTNHDFNQFEKTRGTVASIFGSEQVDRQGFFFTDNVEFAKNFGNKIIKVKLRMNKPFDLSNGLSSTMTAELERHGISFKWMLSNEDWEKFDGEEGEMFVNALKALGYDSAIIQEPDDHGHDQTAYIVFDPSQIKIIG